MPIRIFNFICSCLSPTVDVPLPRPAPFGAGSATHLEPLMSVLNQEFDYKGRGLPPAQGLYHPDDEKDACGVGFVAAGLFEP